MAQYRARLEHDVPKRVPLWADPVRAEDYVLISLLRSVVRTQSNATEAEKQIAWSALERESNAGSPGERAAALWAGVDLLGRRASVEGHLEYLAGCASEGRTPMRFLSWN